MRDAQAAAGMRGQIGAGASTFALEQIYPNPVITTGTNRFAVPVRQRVALRVYDSMGRMVRVLFDEEAGPGAKETIFLPEILPNGVYHLVLETGRQIAHRAFIVSR